MKPIITKAQIRLELENQIQEFLQDGGAVNNIPRGQSGHINNQNLFSSQGGSAPPLSRTPVDDVVKALEERKHTKSGQTKDGRSIGTTKGRRKKLITDDFGEPLRWVWIED